MAADISLKHLKEGEILSYHRFSCSGVMNVNLIKWEIYFGVDFGNKMRVCMCLYVCVGKYVIGYESHVVFRLLKDFLVKKESGAWFVMATI